MTIIDVQTFAVVDYNSVFQQSLGGEASKIIGVPCYQLNHTSNAPCAALGHNCPLQGTVRTCVYASSEHQHQNADGTSPFVELSTSSMKDASGKVVQVVHVRRDVTQRKLVEVEIEQMA